MHVSNGHLSVVEGRENVGNADRDVLRSLGLDDLLGVRIVTEQLGSGRRGGGNWSSRLGSVGGFRRLCRSFAWLAFNGGLGRSLVCGSRRLGFLFGLCL